MSSLAYLVLPINAFNPLVVSVTKECNACGKSLEIKATLPDYSKVLCKECCYGDTFVKFSNRERELKRDIALIQSHVAVLLEKLIELGCSEQDLKEFGVVFKEIKDET